MSRPDQYTTEMNDMPAPTWAGEGLYWNPEYLKWCEERDGVTVPATAPDPKEFESKPFVFTINLKSRNPQVIPSRELKTCPVCEEQFIPVSPRQVVCQRSECRKERTRQLNRAKYKSRPLSIRTCEVCGAQYQPVKGLQKTCSEGCRDIRTKRKNVKHNRTSRETARKEVA